MKIRATRATATPADAEIDLTAVSGGDIIDFVDRVENKVEDIGHRVRYGSNYRQNPRYLRDPDHADDRAQAEKRREA